MSENKGESEGEGISSLNVLKKLKINKNCWMIVLLFFIIASYSAQSLSIIIYTIPSTFDDFFILFKSFFEVTISSNI